jgi:hypothetical protein
VIGVGDSEQITKLGTHTTTLRCEYNDDLSPVEIAYQLAWITSCLPTNRNQSARKHDGDALPDRRPVYSAIGISSELRISRIYL